MKAVKELKGKTCKPNKLSLEVLVENVLGVDVNEVEEKFDGYLLRTNKGKLHLAVKETLYEMEIINAVIE